MGLFSRPVEHFTFLQDHPPVLEAIMAQANALTDEALIKMLRQLEFWHKEQLEDEELVKLTEAMLHASVKLRQTKFQVPKKRFGKTELQISIVTCGGMRLQHTWLPDSLPISVSEKTVLQGNSQTNLKACILACLDHGLNHFETARMYGTSELQFATALGELLDQGVIRREDFVLQTKILPQATREDFQTLWHQSWAHWEQTVGHIDLFAVHVVSSQKTIEWTMQEDGYFSFVKELQVQGKIKHIGFSTHGTAHNVLQLINTELFSFCNLHAHYFGDYHAAGTMNGVDDTSGNTAAVQRALELDMGVFQISPLDKGGKVYQPSATVARLLGSTMHPMTFNLLHGWETLGFHTTSIGISRPADLDDVLHAAFTYSQGNFKEGLKASEDRLNAHMRKELGDEWVRQGLVNIPDCEQKVTQGVAVGHALWCHNLVKAFGMYDFAFDRYASLESAAWSSKKSCEENLKAFPDGNMGRCPVFDGSIDYQEVLKGHYDPKQALEKLQQVHVWLSKSSKITEHERQCRGWEAAYNMTCWDDFPGAAPTPVGVLMQKFTGGYFGCHGGPERTKFPAYAREVRRSLAAQQKELQVPQ